MTFYAFLSPQSSFLVFGIIPAPAWACVAGLFAWDFLNSIIQTVCASVTRRSQLIIIQRGGTIDSPGHIGGLLAGAAYYFSMRRRLYRFK